MTNSRRRKRRSTSPLGAGRAAWDAAEVRYSLTLGAATRDDLRAALERRGVRTNAYFEVLWPRVEIAPSPRVLEVVVTTPAALGLAEGATLGAFLERAATLGLGPCPLEAAAWLRLALSEPLGSPRITVASARVDADEGFPRGLYLREDAEGSWLRAFVASEDWRFEAEERFAVAR